MCARMLTMKHWFRVSFLLCRYKARSVHFAYIVSSLGILGFFFILLIFFFVVVVVVCLKKQYTIHLLLLSSHWPSRCFMYLCCYFCFIGWLVVVVVISIYIFFRFSGSTSHENRIEEQYSIQFEKHRPQWCRSSRWFVLAVYRQ